jgi:hypothetical protein
MPKFYEIHDSLLESIEQDGERVSIRLRAVRAETKKGQSQSNYLRQEIRLVLDGAQLTVDSPQLPSWLLEGSFRCEASDADPADCGPEGTIPVSLDSATGIELVLSGLYEGSGEFVTIGVQAKSLTIERLGDPQSLQYTRASI